MRNLAFSLLLVLFSAVPAKAADVVPISIRSLAVIAEPRLDPVSGAVPWFLVASPAAIDTIEYAYLEGQEVRWRSPVTGWRSGRDGIVVGTPRGEVEVDARGATDVPGVFAAGDVTTVPYKQIVIALGEGAKAALSAFDHLIRSALPDEEVRAA